MRSLRARLEATIVAAVAGFLIVLGVALYLLLRSAMVHDFDHVLTAKAREISGLVELNGDKVKFEFDLKRMPEFGTGSTPSRRPEYFELRLDELKWQARSPSLRQAHLTPLSFEPHTTLLDVRLPNGKAGRMVVLPFLPRVNPDYPAPPQTASSPAEGSGRTAFIALASETHQIDTILQRLRWLMVGLGAAAMGAGVVATRVVTGKLLRPVGSLVRQIAAIREEVLNTRVDAGDAPSEIVPIVDKLNDLLARLHSAFARERGFSADVAHELRTPLSALRAQIEVCRARPRDAESYRQTLDQNLALIQRMEHIVECLLILARAESHQLQVQREPIQLSELLDECWAQVEATAIKRRLRVTRRVDPAIVVETDLEKIRLVLGNLLNNAVTYADEGGFIELTAEREGDGMALQVGNTGSRVRPEDVAHVCDRFWRGDKMRTDAGYHFGLGLTIVQRLTGLLGVTLAIESEPAGWFRVRLRLPTASVAPVGA